MELGKLCQSGNRKLKPCMMCLRKKKQGGRECCFGALLCSSSPFCSEPNQSEFTNKYSRFHQSTVEVTLLNTAVTANKQLSGYEET